MNITQRVRRFLKGLMQLACVVILVLDPDFGYLIVIAFLSVSLLYAGIRQLFYYITMARFMVGGIETLYKGVILLDFGLFVFNLDDLPVTFTMLYLIAMLLFSGGKDILHALDAKRLQTGHWKLEFALSAGQILLGLSCLFFLHSIRAVCYIYSIGLLQSAAGSFVSAFRKTAVVYIE